MAAEEPRKNLEQFIQFVLADPGLHQRLLENRSADDFAARAVRLGAERGCAFTREEVFAALQERAEVLRKGLS